jgi:uncharacterized protein (DUF433 family)
MSLSDSWLDRLFEEIGAQRDEMMDEDKLLDRITVNPKIFGGKPIIRGRRLAVEHVLGMLATGDSVETILEGYPLVGARGRSSLSSICT